MNSTSRAESVPQTASTSQPVDKRNWGAEFSPSETASLYSSVAEALKANRTEFTRPRAIRVKIGTWNVAASKGPEKDIREWFIENKGIIGPSALSQCSTDSDRQEGLGSAFHKRGGDKEQSKPRTHEEVAELTSDIQVIPESDQIELYVLGLQEIVDITSPAEALRPYTDSTVANRYKHAFDSALPSGYKLIAEQQLVGLLLLIYASSAVASEVHSVSSTSIGTGLLGYMGNKGAVATRIVLGESTKVVFINSHMSAGTGKASLERRNWDATQIASRTKFGPTVELSDTANHQDEKIGDEDFAFWFGDLNYRLEGIPGDEVRRILLLHTRHEYGSEQRAHFSEDREFNELNLHTSVQKEIQDPLIYREPKGRPDNSKTTQSRSTWRKSFEDAMIEGNDPASLQATINSLIQHDELLQQQRDRRMFHDGWQEGPITFLPTYKYDLGSLGEFDSSEKKRAPSWCDRILYRSRQQRIAYDEKLLRETESRAKDEAMKAQGMDQAADDEDMLFEYDPDADGEIDGDLMYNGKQDSMSLTPGDIGQDSIILQYYSSHQEILSSDHKPLDAVFILKYQAVIPELRAQIQEKAVRELDRVENEGRPTLTLAIEGTYHVDTETFTGVDFGHLRFEEPKSQSVTIANTGQVTAYFGVLGSNEAAKPSLQYSFSNWLTALVDLDEEKGGLEKRKIDDELSKRRWSLAIPKVFKIEPGDACSLNLTAEVTDIELVRKLNAGNALEDVLVINVKDGRDHFLPVRASWYKSSHGRTIDQLTRIPEGGVRKIQKQHSLDGDVEDSAPVMWSAPREIFRLTEVIEGLVERLVAENSMLGTDLTGRGEPPWETYIGWPFDSESWTLTAEARRKLRLDSYEALDTDSSLDGALPPTLSQLHRLEVIAESLMSFLRNMQGGVITEALWTRVEHEFFGLGSHSTLQPEDQRAAVLEILSQAPNHSVTFVLLTSMLTRIAQEITGTHAVPTTQTRTSLEMKILPKLSIRRKTLELDPRMARRQIVNASFASTFSELLIPTSGSQTLRKKDSNLAQKRELIRMFLAPDTG